MPIRLTIFALLALAFLAAPQASAQIQVDVSLKRSMYIRYEPILLTVTITNRSGGTLDLVDEPPNRWFSVQIDADGGLPIPPIDGNYNNPPLQIAPGKSVSRLVNLTPLFPLSEFGSYRVRANVFAPSLNRLFSSPSLPMEITDGTSLWSREVGVPEGLPGAGSTRWLSVICHRLPQGPNIYIRIQNKDSGTIYCTHRLGPWIEVLKPDVQLDEKNQVHILHAMTPKTYMYSHIGLNGEVLLRKNYEEFKNRPRLGRHPDGSIVVVGGTEFDPTAPKPEQQLPSMGDRPVQPPKPPSKDKPTDKTEEKRPENLLSR